MTTESPCGPSNGDTAGKKEKLSPVKTTLRYDMNLADDTTITDDAQPPRGKVVPVRGHAKLHVHMH